MTTSTSFGGLSGALLLVVLGCGGQTSGDEEDDEERAPPQMSEAPSPPAGDGQPPLGSTPLEACKSGFEVDSEPGLPCKWLHDGLCYETKLEACACACPRSAKTSTCVSGFEDDVTVKVSCL